MAAAVRMGKEWEEEEKRRGLGPILLRKIVGTRDAGGERRPWSIGRRAAATAAETEVDMVVVVCCYNRGVMWGVGRKSDRWMGEACSVFNRLDHDGRLFWGSSFHLFFENPRSFHPLPALCSVLQVCNGVT
jgi:hypothetical protein